MAEANTKKRKITTTLLAGPPYVGKTTILEKFHEFLKATTHFIEDRELIFGRTRFVDRLFVGPQKIEENEIYHIFYAYGGQDWLSTNRRVVLSRVNPDLLVFVCNTQKPTKELDERLSYKMNNFYWDELSIVENIGRKLYEIPKVIVLNKMDLPTIAPTATILSQLGLNPSIIIETDGTVSYPKDLEGKIFSIEDETFMKYFLSTDSVPVFKTVAINGENLENLLSAILTVQTFLTLL